MEAFVDMRSPYSLSAEPGTSDSITKIFCLGIDGSGACGICRAPLPGFSRLIGEQIHFALKAAQYFGGCWRSVFLAKFIPYCIMNKPSDILSVLWLIGGNMLLYKAVSSLLLLNSYFGDDNVFVRGQAH